MSEEASPTDGNPDNKNDTDAKPINEIDSAPQVKDVTSEAEPSPEVSPTDGNPNNKNGTDAKPINETNRVSQAKDVINETDPTSELSESKKRPIESDMKPSQPRPKKAKKYKNKKQIPAEVIEFRRSIHMCCKDDDLHKAIESYSRAVNGGTSIEVQTYHNLISLCCPADIVGFDKKRGIHIGTPHRNDRSDVKEEQTESRETPPKMIVSYPDRCDFAYRLKSDMASLSIPLNETSYTAFVRILSREGKFEEALEFLSRAESDPSIKPKLRLYSSIFICCADREDSLTTLKLWKRLKLRGVELSEREYCALMDCAVKVGDHKIVEKVLSDLAEDVLVPCEETRKVIANWFESESAKRGESPEGESPLDQFRTVLENDSPSMGPVVSLGGYQISQHVAVDVKTGTLQSGCLHRACLKPVCIPDRARHELKDLNVAIVLNGGLPQHSSPFQGGGKGPKRRLDAEKRKVQWNRFTDFLSARRRPAEPLDAVLDGANIGYFQQNFANSPKHVDYRQIDWVVRHFMDRNKSVLLVMHERHFHHKQIPEWAVEIVRTWETNGVLYKTPGGFNDDSFWLHAALESDCVCVTNDEMRDHHFQMLQRRQFGRWKERRKVGFKFGNWVDRKREVILSYPEVYSRRIQKVTVCVNGADSGTGTGSDIHGWAVPCPKRGDEGRFLDGEHVAQEEREEETYLCISAIV